MQHGNDEVAPNDDMCQWCGEKVATIFFPYGSYCSNRCKSRANSHRERDE